MIRNMIALFLLVSIFSSCKDDESIPKEQVLTLDNSVVALLVDEQITLTPTFDDGREPQRNYEWSVVNNSLIELTYDPKSYVATLTGKASGTTDVVIASTDGVLQALCTVTVSIPETSVTIQQTAAVNVKQQVVITPEFDRTPVRTYSWQTDPQGIATLTVNEATLAVTIEGLREGTTTLTLRSADGEISASSEITVSYVPDAIIKILTIGNSFSEDAVEHYLYGLAQAAGKEVVIGNMYIGGAQLALHHNNATSNSSAYSYRKIEINGIRTMQSGFSIISALEDEDWDYISFQQASDFSGVYETFVTPLPALLAYTKARAINPNTQYVLHQTWAYAQNSTHPAFPTYGQNQLTMYDAIVDAYVQAAELVDIEIVVPSGTAIQNGRTSSVGDNFNSDGYHLNPLGRYTASCTWFEKILGESVVNNTYKPAGYTPAQISIAQRAAHEAVQNPNTITTITD